MNIEIAEQIADVCVNALRRGNKIMFCGNGGSAADSQHLAAELVGKLNFQRPPLAAMALTTDTSVLTAIGNDYGFDQVFSRQIAAIGKSGDVLIAMSTSGNSENILKAIHFASESNIKVVGKTGKTGGKMVSTNMCDLLFQVHSDDTQKIQEEHMKLGHEYCGLIEKKMFG